jgi:aspartate/methionine/tyrosine aminotransferase
VIEDELLNEPEMLRLENLDTDLAPPAVAVEVMRRALSDDAANSYLPFEGHHELRQAAAAHVSRISAVSYDPIQECVGVLGGTNGVLGFERALGGKLSRPLGEQPRLGAN